MLKRSGKRILQILVAPRRHTNNGAIVLKDVISRKLRQHHEADFPTLVDVAVATLVVVATPVPLVAVKNHTYLAV